MNLREAPDGWSGGGGGGGSAARRKDGGDDGDPDGGGWPPSGKKGLDLEEDTRRPSFSCRQKAHIPPPATAAAAPALAGRYGCSLQYWIPSSGGGGGGAVPSSWSPAPAAATAVASGACFSPMDAPLRPGTRSLLPVSWPAEHTAAREPGTGRRILA
uniref:Uncharacterized protein n=1 Tax=Zea mays TaxID=4577 RepID=C4J5J9_MAIZE|nr:unknown [Zea mays]